MSGEADKIVTIERAEIFELCQRLGHDPARVARIVIEPHVVVVEYEHPVIASPAPGRNRPEVIQHPIVKPASDGG